MTPTASQTPIIELEGICFAYPGGQPILDQLGFTVHRGDKIGLVAPNGSGKTTLFHIIMGLLKPTAGTLTIFGQPVRGEKDFLFVRQRIGLLFQDADDQLFSPTVIEDVAFGPLNMGRSKEEALAISRQVLGTLGLEAFENRITYKLSGGEKRLVALATVLAMSPEVLLLDEPTSGLDERTKERLKSILQQLDLSYVLISHEFNFMVDVVDSYYTMQAGKIVEDAELHHHVHAHCHPMGKQPHDHP